MLVWLGEKAWDFEIWRVCQTLLLAHAASPWGLVPVGQAMDLVYQHIGVLVSREWLAVHDQLPTPYPWEFPSRGPGIHYLPVVLRVDESPRILVVGHEVHAATLLFLKPS
jgi:hypothetical protein